MKVKAYTLKAEVDITFTLVNPWESRKDIAKMLKDAVERTFDAAKVEVSIPEMQHGEIERPDQKLDLIKPYGDYNKMSFLIDDVPPEIAEQLYPNMMKNLKTYTQLQQWEQTGNSTTLTLSGHAIKGPHGKCYIEVPEEFKGKLIEGAVTVNG